MGDVTLTFADSILIPAKILFLHPTHNLAFLSYDPSLLGDTPVESAPLSPIELKQGNKTTLVALNHNHVPVCVDTSVTDITAIVIPQRFFDIFYPIIIKFYT